MSGQLKYGARRRYSEAQLAIFEENRPSRELARPRECTGGALCWVALGPLGITTNSRCVECEGTPRSLKARYAS